MRSKDINMLSGPITRGLWAVCAPVMIMNVLQSLFGIVDMTVLKAFDTDGMAVGAVGVCGVLITMFTNLVIGVAAGANVIVARYIGQRDQNHTSRAVGTAIAVSVVAGLVISAIGLLCADLFLTWVNCPQELFSGASLYFRLYFAGIPILTVFHFCSSVLRASGNAKQIMTISIVGAAAKVGFTFLFVAVLRLGIVGVAISSILSWCVNTGWSLITLLREQGAVRLYTAHIRFYRPELPHILRVGIPSSLQMGLFALANVVISSAVNAFGPQATTGVSIANNFDGLLYYICNAASLAVMPYVSQNVGAGNIKRAGQAVRRGILMTLGLGLTFGFLTVTFSKELASLMSNDPATIAYAQQKTIVAASTYFICGINDIVCAALRGMGRSLSPTIATLVFMCILRFVWVYWIFPLLPNLTFLYFVWPIGWVLSIITLLFVLVPTVKMRKAEFAVE